MYIDWVNEQFDVRNYKIAKEKERLKNEWEMREKLAKNSLVGKYTFNKSFDERDSGYIDGRTLSVSCDADRYEHLILEIIYDKIDHDSGIVIYKIYGYLKQKVEIGFARKFNASCYLDKEKTTDKDSREIVFQGNWSGNLNDLVKQDGLIPHFGNDNQNFIITRISNTTTSSSESGLSKWQSGEYIVLNQRLYFKLTTYNVARKSFSFQREGQEFFVSKQ